MSMMNLYPSSIHNPISFLGIYQQGGQIAYYNQYNFKELTQEHIEKIYKINNTFLAHRERLLTALFSDAIKINEFTFGNNIFRLCIKQYGIYEVGYWECCVDQNLIPKIPSIPLLFPPLQDPVINLGALPSPSNINSNSSSNVEIYLVSSDLISLVAVYYGYTFIEALELIYGHITTNNTLYPHVIKGKGGYKEELFPIAKKFDLVKINNKFIQQLEKHGAVLSVYLLNKSTTFLYKYYYKNKYNQYVEIFLGYFHRFNSPINTFIAMDISQFNSLDFQRIDNCGYNESIQGYVENFYNSYKKQIKFLFFDLPNDFREISLSRLPSNFPYGLMIKNINYLYQFDFSTLKEHVVFIEIDANYYKDAELSSQVQHLMQKDFDWSFPV